MRGDRRVQSTNMTLVAKTHTNKRHHNCIIGCQHDHSPFFPQKFRVMKTSAITILTMSALMGAGHIDALPQPQSVVAALNSNSEVVLSDSTIEFDEEDEQVQILQGTPTAGEGSVPVATMTLEDDFEDELALADNQNMYHNMANDGSTISSVNQQQTPATASLTIGSDDGITKEGSNNLASSDSSDAMGEMTGGADCMTSYNDKTPDRSMMEHANDKETMLQQEDPILHRHDEETKRGVGGAMLGVVGVGLVGSVAYGFYAVRKQRSQQVYVPLA